MARTLAEVDADLERLRAGGVDMRTAPAKALRDERALIEAQDAVMDDLPAEVPSEGTDPHKTAEWAFIQQAIASTEMEFKPGLMTGMAKKMFHVLAAKVTLWRIANDIVRQVGIGNEWPQWTALGRNEDTGAIVLDKPPPPAIVRSSASVEIAPTVTMGGMPIVNTAPPMDQMEAMKAAIRGQVAGDVNGRPTPQRAPVTA